MSARFVAPPLHPRSNNNPQNTPVTSAAKNEYLPPPSHPALARRRLDSPGPEGVGALNSGPVSRPHSPVPPPQRVTYTVPYADEPDVSHSADWNPPNAPTDSLNLVTSPNGHSNDPSRAQTGSHSILSASSVAASTPLLLVTPDATNSNNVPSEYAPRPAEAVPPYSSQPDPPSHFDSVATESLRPDAESSTRNNNTQHQGPNTDRVPPPLHPSRQPSPSPSFIDAPTLRHRAQSSTNLGSARDPDAGTSTRPTLEPSRRGSGASVLTLKDANLTDEDLRKMYDAEEIERYLRLFASRVNEVALDPDHPDVQIPTHEDENDWISVSSVPPSTKPALPPNLANPTTPFEYVASWLYPYALQSSRLPTGIPGAKRKFKLSRAANASKRLYLAVYPAYIPILIHLAHLSSWRDPRKSGIYCAIYWGAWAAGLISPLIVGRLLYFLVTGGTVTRDEIRRRREAAREAEKLGRAIEGGIPGVGVHGDLGIWDVTKLVTGLGKRKGKKVKAAAEEVRQDNEGQVQLGSADCGEPEDAEDWKLMLVDLAEELADLHERVKNIFLHRRPETTRIYIILLSLLFVATILVQNTSKFVTLGMGFFFWFVPPVVKLLPRLPPAFADAPTDAEIAMELISKRVARGERVVPERIAKRKKNKNQNKDAPTGLASPLSINASASRSMLELTDSPAIMSPSTTSFGEVCSTDDEDAEIGFVVPTNKTGAVGEDKLRKGAVKAWNWFGRTKQMMDQARGVQGSGTIWASAEQSFPAQHRSRPGMLMISATSLTFNPLFTSNPAQPVEDTKTIKVDIDNLRGVKKVTPGGLIVRFVKGPTVVEERFLFVVGRDEAFATLVGWGGGRWKHV